MASGNTIKKYINFSYIIQFVTLAYLVMSQHGKKTGFGWISGVQIFQNLGLL
jgi:hypothetical protein